MPPLTRSRLFLPAPVARGTRKCHAILFALICTSFLPACASLCLADVTPWNAGTQGQFITSLCRDTTGHVWIGTEDQGIWRCDPTAPKDNQYTHFTTKDGLGDDNSYALVCDKAGRIWAGTLNHGVSVYNGKQWKTYGPVDGPLGSRIFALAVSPKDGGVWGATEAGLFRYKNSRWTYFTRADGLPSDQANALAFAADGTLYVGTQCDGIAIASPDDNYKSWRVVPGPTTALNAPAGTGLPSALINCLLVSSDNVVYAGTDGGLAASRDEGITWTFVRGLDWTAKLAGLLHPVMPITAPVSSDLLSEDYVTCLAEGDDGRIFVGHRQTGLEAFAPKTGKRVQSGANGTRSDSDIFSLLVSGETAWVGQYGGGLLTPVSSALKTVLSSSAATIPLPIPAKPPMLSELNAMLARVKLLKVEMPVGGAVYLGEDWQTQGDWLGHYGRQSTILCAADAPLDHDIISDPAYRTQISMGPHHPPGDSIRRWDTWTQTDNPKSLYDPIPGNRRQSEADDHGESMVGPGDSFAYQGPDVWVTVTVPEGTHRVSLYDFNKDGHDSNNRFRDYKVDVLPYSEDAEAVQEEAPLAHARINNFWGGVYETFLVRGPSKYIFRVAKNSSLNTILPAVLIDRIGGMKTRRDCNAWMGGVRYAPPDPDAPIPPDPHLLDKLLAANGKLLLSIGGKSPTPQALKTIAAARALWDALDAAQNNPASLPLQLSCRLLAYRAAVKAGATDALQTEWRWALHFWTPADRQEFTDITQQAHESLLNLNPDMRNHSY
ncbi:MAG: ligand-binding sensor domain-containing protein [Janthinobacterium lividum]